MEVLVTGSKANLSRLKIHSLSNNEICFRPKRCFSSPIKLIELDFSDKFANGPRSSRRQLLLYYWIVKEIIKHPKFLLKKIASTYKLEMKDIKDSDFPIKFALEGIEERIWISRKAIEFGIWPSEIDSKLEYDLIRNPQQFDVFIHNLENKSNHFKIYEKIQGNFSINQKVNEIKFETHSNAIVHHGKVVITNEVNLVNIDDVYKNCSKKIDLFNCDKSELSVLKSFKSLDCIDSAIFIGSSLSWYHFMVECASKLTKIPSDLLENTPVILERNVPESICAAVKMVTGTEPIMVGNYESLKVRNLHLVSGSMTTEYLFNSGILKQLKILMLNKFGNQITKSNRKIYLKRPSNLFRPLQNEKRLTNFLRKNEFEIIEPSTISLKEQIEIMREARVIVAESGAALTNVMFAEDKTKLIELHPAVDYSDFWKDYSLNFIQEYKKIYGKKRYLGRKGLARDGFVIEIKKLEKALNGPMGKA